ncbi:MAG: hypothetical protein L0271_02875, partial [Gemmatimonadetes bacterium]|nr:hypothetical protein [Gemmatimonadota bacterium]
VHVAITYDRPAGVARFYKNGVLWLEQVIGTFTPRTNLGMFFGANYQASDRYLGVLDEVSLYTRPLSLAEVQAIHVAGAAGKAPLDDNQPPVLSAGPDAVVINASAAAPLNGSVSDDGRPAGQPLTIAWSKVEGPGTVTFANPASPATTATFSQPGTYVLRLDARDAMHAAVPDIMVVRVGVTASVEPDSALAAWWPANGDVREVIRGNHDIEFLPAGPAFATGQIAQGFTFNGSDHYGRVPAHSDLDIGASAAGLTIEFWAKPSQVGTRDATLLQWGSLNSTAGLQVMQRDNAGRHLSMNWYDTTGNNRGMEVGSMFATDTWVHVAITYDRPAGVARFYKNGVL